MDCKAASELIMKYLDKDITNEEREILFTHLDSCESCSMEFEALTNALLAIEDTEMEEAPENLEKVVIARIQKEDTAAAKKRGWWMSTAACIAVVAGWLGITYLFMYTPTIDMMADSFNYFLYIVNRLIELSIDLWRTGFTGAVKLLTVGRAFNVVQRVMLETYSLAIIAMILMMAVILRLYGHMFRSIRR